MGMKYVLVHYPFSFWPPTAAKMSKANKLRNFDSSTIRTSIKRRKTVTKFPILCNLFERLILQKRIYCILGTIRDP